MIASKRFRLQAPACALALALAIALSAGAAGAQTTVADAWVRGTVPQQKATGLFATITSAQGGRLVEALSPAAGVVEIHEMSMDGNVMRMRALPAGLALPAGQPVSLKPGGYHLMLLDLKQPLKAGDSVSVTLVVEGADKQRQNIEVKALVRPLAGAAAAAPHGEHKH
ncbi:MAG: copper chaperone PCu(A)C [Rubrivivax sp.]|nr:copper chaperone PCu(A)C [Rubrivivax sp.]